MGLMLFHYIMVVMEGNKTMSHFLLPKWNGICAIPPYIDTSGMQLWQCHLLDYSLGGILYINSLCPFVRLTRQFCILIHQQNWPLPASTCSDPVIWEVDSATPLCVRPSVRLSVCPSVRLSVRLSRHICFFFYLFFWDLFFRIFLPVS
jgi:hypothetical protein